jgi:hypothetical protein
MIENKWSVESKLVNMLHTGKHMRVFIDWMNAHRTCGGRICLGNIGFLTD